MGKTNVPRPTESELEILQVLWQNGPSTVRFVNDELSKRREVGYTTTLKLLQLMHEKGIVARDDSSRTHVYRPALREQETQGVLIDRLLEAAFGGSALKLVQQALGNRRTSREELSQIRDLLDQIDPQEPRPTNSPNPDELA
ncbi:BlaI/MecI/CopY family transcriptional regulator [Hymenobacter sp. B81]|uniref:BlaI/MecI/CopY family transcriptional regulator n=1 Tax=Hymenobacter sp. B81 TaxID=3344878 RepID=UPI0037DC1AEA